MRLEMFLRVNKVNLMLPMDYSVVNDILVAQVVGAEIYMLGPDLTVIAQSTKMLFTNSYRWVERDNLIKRVMHEKNNPNEPLVYESVIIDLGPTEISKKDMFR